MAIQAPTTGTPRWVQGSSLLLCLAGLAVSIYLTYEHYSASTTLACPDTGVVNCLKVTTSQYSTLIGIPVALLGLLFFVAETLLCLPWAWRARLPAVGFLRLAGVSVGVLFVFYLVYAELFRIDAICLYCTAVHVITLLLFFVVAFGQALTGTGHTASPEG